METSILVDLLDQSIQTISPITSTDFSGCGDIDYSKSMIDPRRINVEETSAFGLMGLSIVQLGSVAQNAIPAMFVVLQADQIAQDLCEAGLGSLATIGLFLLAAMLFIKSFPDVAKGFDAKGSSSSGSQRQSSQHFRNAAMKLVGAIVIATLPTLLATAGFSLFGCIEAVTIFS